MDLTLIVAVTPQGVIGHQGALPWHLPGDLGHFRCLTMGGTLIMGRKTFDSIGRPLQGRETVVLTRDPEWSWPGVFTAGDADAAVLLAEEIGKPAFVVGGAEVYRQMMPWVMRMVVTHVHAEFVGDTHFMIDHSRFCVDPQTCFHAAGYDVCHWYRKPSAD